jgi:FtsZ-interacting cell division protein YlmF
MSSFFRKTLSFFGLAEEEELEVEEEEGSSLRGGREIPKEKMVETGRAAVKKPPRKKVSLISSARDSKKNRVFVAEPREFEEIQVIADNFKNDIPVIVNLQRVEPEVSKRIIDFCSGLTYALEGDIKKVADRVFLIIPSNIEVNTRENDLLSEDGFLKSF